MLKNSAVICFFLEFESQCGPSEILSESVFLLFLTSILKTYFYIFSKIKCYNNNHVLQHKFMSQLPIFVTIEFCIVFSAIFRFFSLKMNDFFVAFIMHLPQERFSGRKKNSSINDLPLDFTGHPKST